MRKTQLDFVSTFMLMLGFSIAISAQTGGRIESMKLLTPEVGWAATNQELFWTSDGGAQWKDITPRGKSNEGIASVFFVDASAGWVLLARAGHENSRTNVRETFFELASTANSGQSWTVKPLDFPDPEPSRGLSGDAWVDFVDAQHGWVLVRMNSNTSLSMGVLRSTEDGGKTWKSLGVPAAGPIRFVTQKDGWMEGGPTEEVTHGIYVTRDGGSSWALVSMKAPKEVLPKSYPEYQLPQFVDKDTGFLLVTFSEPNDESPKLALFTTRDGGRTWTFGSVLEEAGPTSWYAAVAGRNWLAAGCPKGTPAIVHATGGSMSVAAPLPGKAGPICTGPAGVVSGFSFVGDNRGWLLLFSGKLLSTSDGGATWDDTTPTDFGKETRGGSASNTAPSNAEPLNGLSAESPAPSPSNVSMHLGFDRFPVIPTVSDMQNWMSFSPFYDVAIYLPGSKNKTVGHYLGAGAEIMQPGKARLPNGRGDLKYALRALIFDRHEYRHQDNLCSQPQ